MSPTPEELELGAKAYERVRVYEKYGARNARQMPWIQAGCGLLLILSVFLFKIDFGRHDVLPFFIFIPAFILLGWAQNRMAKENYANQKLMLQLLEEKYGDMLPWVEEEKQLALARELEAKIALIKA
jgi:hypothetical protein